MLTFKDFKDDPYAAQLSGVYLIIFPNGKKYFGTSKNVYRRINEHLRHLARRDDSWYTTAAEENNLGSEVYQVYGVIEILYSPSEDNYNLEYEMLQKIEDRTAFYNTSYNPWKKPKSHIVNFE